MPEWNGQGKDDGNFSVFLLRDCVLAVLLAQTGRHSQWAKRGSEELIHEDVTL